MTAGDLVLLFQRAAEARRVENVAREEYQGGSWGYHGESFIRDAEEAEAALEKALNEFVDARVKAIIENIQEKP